jgi:hypothetical protein
MQLEGEGHCPLTMMTKAANNKTDTIGHKVDTQASDGQGPRRAVYMPSAWSPCHGWVAATNMREHDAERVVRGVWGCLLTDTLWVPM